MIKSPESAKHISTYKLETNLRPRQRLQLTHKTQKLNQLLGHVSNSFIPGDFQSFFPKTTNSLLSSSPLTPNSQYSESGRAKIENAINYLILRDLGCTKKDAITYSSIKLSKGATIVNSLPISLKQEYKQRVKKNESILNRYNKSEEKFNYISETLKDQIERNKYNFNTQIEKVDKYVETIKSKVNKIRPYKDLDIQNSLKSVDTVESPKLIFSRKRTVVPDVAKTFESLVTSAKVTPKKIDRLSGTCETGLLVSPSQESKLSIQKPTKNLLRSTICNSPAEIPHKKQLILKALSYEDTAQIEENESSEIDVPALMNEQKKLNNLIRLQKYRQAKKIGEEKAKAFEKIKEKRKLLEIEDNQKRLEKYMIKKDKIIKANLKKEGFILNRSQQKSLTVKNSAKSRFNPDRFY
jgi:hypothetical protein